MKKVIKESKETISLDELNDKMFIGVEYSDGERGFLVKYKEGKYILANLFDSNYYYNKATESSIKKVINKKYIKEAYVFETHEERTEWLIGKK